MNLPSVGRFSEIRRLVDQRLVPTMHVPGEESEDMIKQTKIVVDFDLFELI